MFKAFLIVTFTLTTTNAFAYHKIYCSNPEQTVLACIFSDAGFGWIISAYIERDHSKDVYTIFQSHDAPDHTDANGLAVINFVSKQKLILDSTESFAEAYDSDGNLLDKMSCEMVFDQKCQDLGPGGIIKPTVLAHQNH